MSSLDNYYMKSRAMAKKNSKTEIRALMTSTTNSALNRSRN